MDRVYCPLLAEPFCLYIFDYDLDEIAVYKFTAALEGHETCSSALDYVAAIKYQEDVICILVHEGHHVRFPVNIFNDENSLVGTTEPLCTYYERKIDG